MTDDGDAERELQEILANVTSMIELIEKINNSHMAMQTLASCTAFVLCNRMHSAEEANHEFKMFQRAVDAAVKRAIVGNQAFWPEGSVH
jgi:hypothetical protein